MLENLNSLKSFSKMQDILPFQTEIVYLNSNRQLNTFNVKESHFFVKRK